MTDKEIEKAAAQHADGIKIILNTPDASLLVLYSIAKSSFRQGARFALSHQWVSVEDALPEDETEVLVCVPRGDYRGTYYALAWYDGEDWYTTDNDYHIRPSQWLDFPDAPQLNNEKEEQ